MEAARPDPQDRSTAEDAPAAEETPHAGEKDNGGSDVVNDSEGCKRKREDSDAESCPRGRGASSPDGGADGVTRDDARGVITPTPPPPPTAHVIFVADASSSMKSFGRAPAAGMREFLNSQRSDNTASSVELEVRVFSNAVSKVFGGRSDSIREEDVDRCVVALASGGGTRLYDALGEALVDQDQRADARGTGRGLLVVVLTDGEDTCSDAWSVGGVRVLAATFKEKGGDVVWMQANLDAVHEGAAVGVGEEQTLQVGSGAEAMMGAFRALTCATTRYCTTATQESSGPDTGEWPAIPHLEFTALERCSSCPTPAQQTFLERQVAGHASRPYSGDSPPATQMEGIEEEDVAGGESSAPVPACAPMARGQTDSVTVRPASRW
jgi:Mg-chelatase subunit ChlD